jgi:predicted metal-binding membrane protein
MKRVVVAVVFGAFYVLVWAMFGLSPTIVSVLLAATAGCWYGQWLAETNR